MSSIQPKKEEVHPEETPSDKVSDNANSSPEPKRRKCSLDRDGDSKGVIAPMTIKDWVQKLSSLQSITAVREALLQIAEEIRGENRSNFIPRIICGLNGVPLTIEAMRTFPDDPDIQKDSLSIFSAILGAFRGVTYVLVDGDVFNLAVSAARNFPDNTKAYHCALSLFNKAWDSYKGLLDIGKIFLPFLGSALCGDDENIASESAQCLWRMSDTEKGRKMIIEAGLHHQIEDIAFKTTSYPS